MASTNIAVPVSMETPISVRVSIQNSTRKFKIPLGELNAQVLPGKLRVLLGIPENQTVIFERFSDSAAAYVTLDPNNSHVYKTLFRAAKAKLKLRLRATFPNAVTSESTIPPTQPMGLSNAFALAFPELHQTAPMTSLALKSDLDSLRSNASAETLIPVVNGSTEPAKPETPTRSAQPKRVSARLNRDGLFPELAGLSRQRELALRTKELAPSATANCSWSVFCNSCDEPMADAHYHCNICDNGDYDLCEGCVNSGTHCLGENHWLVKRSVQQGQVVNSTTERLRPKPAKEALLPEMPGAFTEHIEEKKPAVEVEESVFEATRTCNCCVKEDQDNRFVTCLDCPDYDLCISCHEANTHGHHPAHKFKAVDEHVPLTPLAEFLCAPGRNAKHAALCDGCDKPIFGVRHKCLYCPDWDFCSECVKNANYIHPGHRFAPLYEPIAAPRYRKVRHVGIYCDGPLCEKKHDYIEGTRYKCVICHDTDFCAKCEAYPQHKHNHTHPLIQFKTPVRNATITTVHEDQYGCSLAPKGDRNAPKAESSKAPTNAATQVQTIIDVKPADAPAYKPSKEKIEIKDLLAEPIQEKIKVQDLLSSPVEEPKRVVDVNKLNAVFVRETIPDGYVVNAASQFTQVWTLRNSGQAAWPAGCSVRYTGGDNMLDSALETTESNVVDGPVEVGEEIAFRVTMKAPQSLGTKISYWRLKTADGQAFGDSLWCHVSVALSYPQEPSSLPQVVSAEVPRHQSGEWRDTFIQQALQHRADRARAIEKQRLEFERIKAKNEAKEVADAQAKTHRLDVLRRLSNQIHAVETQHKARATAARAAMDAARVAQAPVSPPQPASELPAPVSPLTRACRPATSDERAANLQAHQTQLDTLGERSLKHAQEAEMKAKIEATRHVQEQRLQEQKARQLGFENRLQYEDYQMQLMLLEQQNKKRLLMARAMQDQQEAAAPVEVEAEVRPVTVEDVEDEETKLETKSTMIFPKLDKESPVSSVHDVSSSATTKAEGAPLPASPKSDKSDLEIFEDAESVSLVESSDEEDGFLTDEEYDILDASDEEVAA